MGLIDDFFSDGVLQPVALGPSSSSGTRSDADGPTKAKRGAELAAYHAAAVAKVNSTWASSSSSKSAVLGALEADRKRIDRLRTGDLYSLELSKWEGIAKSTHDDIAAQVGLTDEWSVSGVVGNTVAATAADVKQLASTWGPWVLGVAGLLAVAYLAGPAIRSASR
jgi:hypothetical protein